MHLFIMEKNMYDGRKYVGKWYDTLIKIKKEGYAGKVAKELLVSLWSLI